MVNREELAWAAGFFDGEGTIGVCTPPSKPARHLQVRASQANRIPLDRLRRAVLDCGKVYGPYSNGPLSTQPIFQYQAASFEHAQATIAMLWPFLCEPKRAQAEKALRAIMKGRRHKC